MEFNIMFPSFTNQHKSSASVVDGKLVLSFPGAEKPVVWQMCLNDAKVSALEIEKDEAGEEFTYALLLKNSKGETTPVARFEKRREALSALMAASKALKEAKGQIFSATDGANASCPSGKRRSGFRWIFIFGLLVLGVMALLNILSRSGWNDPRALQDTLADSALSSGVPSAAGVPVSADDFLKGR